MDVHNTDKLLTNMEAKNYKLNAPVCKICEHGVDKIQTTSTNENQGCTGNKNLEEFIRVVYYEKIRGKSVRHRRTHT